MSRNPNTATFRPSCSSTAPAPTSRTRWCRSGRCWKAAPKCCFLDRPGHGWSGRSKRQRGAPEQAALTLPDFWTGSALARPSSSAIPWAARSPRPSPSPIREKARALSSCRPPRIRGPGGRTSWYYQLPPVPVLGRMFSETVACPAGCVRIGPATTCVFAPNALPEDISGACADPTGTAAAGVPRQRRGCRGPLPLRARQRPALSRDLSADRGGLGRRRHGGLRGGPLARPGARHSGRRTGLGEESRPQARLDRVRPHRRGDRKARRHARSIFRRWRGRSKPGSPATAFRRR